MKCKNPKCGHEIEYIKGFKEWFHKFKLTIRKQCHCGCTKPEPKEAKKKT